MIGVTERKIDLCTERCAQAGIFVTVVVNDPTRVTASARKSFEASLTLTCYAPANRTARRDGAGRAFSDRRAIMACGA